MEQNENSGTGAVVLARPESLHSCGDQLTNRLGLRRDPPFKSPIGQSLALGRGDLNVNSHGFFLHPETMPSAPAYRNSRLLRNPHHSLDSVFDISDVTHITRDVRVPRSWGILMMMKRLAAGAGALRRGMALGILSWLGLKTENALREGARVQHADGSVGRVVRVEKTAHGETPLVEWMCDGCLIGSSASRLQVLA